MMILEKVRAPWLFIPALIAAFIGMVPTMAQNIETTVVADSLDTPWEMQWGPDDWIWFTERKGNLKKADPETGEVKLIARIQEVRERSEGGLMGVVLHPDFQDKSWVFIAYNYINLNNSYQVKVVRYNYNNNSLTNKTTIIDGIDGNNIHDGCRLVISPARKLFISTGDAGKAYQYPQNSNSVNGKVLRLNLDGSVPASNPIPGNPMWSKGHRNAQGLVLANGILYSSEHGPASDDEFNLIRKGRNYGWPQVKGYCDENQEHEFCQDSNVVEPLKAWTPTEAVCGIDYYGSNRIAEWNNAILMATLGFSENDGRALFKLQLNEQGNEVVNTQRFLVNQYGRLRDVLVGPEGKVYVANSNRDGRGDPAPTDDRIIQLDSSGDSGVRKAGDNWLQVEPNPFHESTRITFNKPFTAISLRLVDNNGMQLRQQTIQQTSHYTLERNNLPNGVYFLKLRTLNTGEKAVKKIVIR